VQTQLATVEQIHADGFAIVPSALSRQRCERVVADLGAALARCPNNPSVLRRAGGAVYGARNLLAVFPEARTVWRTPPLVEVLLAVLGSACGLVRGLYFDKPPESTWSLPWHQDLTIAVLDHALPSTHFRNPTVKAGVPHVEGPDELLREMLTLRIHLDDVTTENGPLVVLPGTHGSRDAPATRPPQTILAQAGDVLAMRPLLAHSSGASTAGTTRHRRILHLEFAARRELPDGYAWHDFVPLA
jgi:hypothetical protein